MVARSENRFQTLKESTTKIFVKGFCGASVEKLGLYYIANICNFSFDKCFINMSFRFLF